VYLIKAINSIINHGLCIAQEPLLVLNPSFFNNDTKQQVAHQHAVGQEIT
jgi:hypothetical protein